MPREMLFRTGEFARLLGVNKRTLHYYDSIGVFSPERVAPNGYRLYSSRQIYPFYMIRMLGEMGLELSEIQDYMRGRSPARFLKLLTEQEEWLDGELQKLRRRRGSVENQRRVLLEAEACACGRVEERQLGGEKMLISKNIHDLAMRQDWDKIEAEYAQELSGMLSEEYLAGYTIGAMTASDDYMEPGRESYISHYMIIVRKFPKGLPRAFCHVRPVCRYLVTYFSGDYTRTAPSYARLRDYMHEHALRPTGFAYEECLVEEMGAESEKDYLTRIAVPVQPEGMGKEEQ